MADARFFRSFWPSVVFCKGGFVSVPVGVAAKLSQTPLITHDSDSNSLAVRTG